MQVSSGEEEEEEETQRRVFYLNYLRRKVNIRIEQEQERVSFIFHPGTRTSNNKTTNPLSCVRIRIVRNILHTIRKEIVLFLYVGAVTVSFVLLPFLHCLNERREFPSSVSCTLVLIPSRVSDQHNCENWVPAEIIGVTLDWEEMASKAV